MEILERFLINSNPHKYHWRNAGSQRAFHLIWWALFFYVHFQKEEIHMELNEEEKRQLFQVDGDCQAKAPAKQKWQFSLDRCAIDIL